MGEVVSLAHRRAEAERAKAVADSHNIFWKRVRDASKVFNYKNMGPIGSILFKVTVMGAEYCHYSMLKHIAQRAYEEAQNAGK